jgi:hypothetical protein
LLTNFARLDKPGKSFSTSPEDVSILPNAPGHYNIGSGPTLHPTAISDPLLLMTSGMSPDNHIIKRYSNESEIKGLGVYLNFTGTFSLHAKMMRTKFDALASQLSQSTLLPSLARVFYHSFYIPSVTYSLPVTSMLKKQSSTKYNRR